MEPPTKKQPFRRGFIFIKTIRNNTMGRTLINFDWGRKRCSEIKQILIY